MSYKKYVECAHVYCYLATGTTVYGNQVDHTEYYWCCQCGTVKKKHVPRNDFEHSKEVELELPRITQNHLDLVDFDKELKQKDVAYAAGLDTCHNCEHVGDYSVGPLVEGAHAVTCKCGNVWYVVPGGTDREQAEANGVYVDSWGN